MEETKFKNLEPNDLRKTIPELSYESKLLFERLRELQPDEFVGYPELSELIGRDVQKYSGSLRTAIRKCLNELHIVIETVRNEGVKRLTDSETIRASDRFGQHVRRMARVARRKISTVDYDQLSAAEKIAHNARLSQYGAIGFFATENVAKKLEQKVEQSQKQIPIGKTLEIFK